MPFGSACPTKVLHVSSGKLPGVLAIVLYFWITDRALIPRSKVKLAREG
jgi:hypothetical protein